MGSRKKPNIRTPHPRSRSAAHELAVRLALGEMYARLGRWPSARDAALAAQEALKPLLTVLVQGPKRPNPRRF